MENAREWKTGVCKKAAEPEHAAMSLQIMERTIELSSVDSTIQWTEVDFAPLTTYKSSDDIMSRMHHTRECFSQCEWREATGKGVQLIEPLWAFLRDPFDKWCGQLEEYTVHTRYGSPRCFFP